MNWEETLLTDEQMEKAMDTSRDEFWERLPDHKRADWGAQAEASFKAGIREVVEWIQANDINWSLDIEVPWDSWEAKLKEWGIKEVAWQQSNARCATTGYGNLEGTGPMIVGG